MRCWHRNIFSELYNNDALWAYSIRVLEEIWVADHTKVKDPVLCHLMAMGTWDWDKKEGACQGHSGPQLQQCDSTRYRLSHTRSLTQQEDRL